MIDIKETQEWYAKERNIKVDEFDDYDAHVCRVANAYGNAVKNLTIPCVSNRRELLIAFCNKWNNDRTDFAKIELEEIDSFLLKAIYSC